MATEAPTPSVAPTRGRDDFLDIVRAFAMIAVVANHTLYTVMAPDPRGGWALSMLQERGLPWVTWPFLWELPGFFLPAAALSFRPALRGTASHFVSRRLWRLLIPLLPLAVGLTVLELSMRAGWSGDCRTWNTSLTCATAMPLAPTWFLLVMVPLTAVSPWLARRWNRRTRWILPAVAVVVAAASDLSTWLGAGPLALTEFTVFGIVWAAGFAYAAGDLEAVTTRRWWTIAAVGAVAIVALVATGRYSARLGASPRSLLSVAELVVGVSMLMGARPWLVARRHRGVVAAGVRLIGDSTMGVFLWHYFAFGTVMGIAAMIGVELATSVGLGYLLQRVVIIALSVGLLVVLVRLVRPVERWPYPADRLRRAATAP